MLTLMQNYRNGVLELVNLDEPSCGPRELIIETKSSLISVGTERSINKLAKQNLLRKAQSRPDLVKRVIEKIKTEGVIKTYKDVQARLDQFLPLGYSACGFVQSIGSEVTEFQPGDFVSVIGANIASHSSLISSPQMMCAKVHESIGDAASFGMLGVISMHGFRMTSQQPGSVIAVVGLGLIGNLTLQILNAYGYVAVGYDLDPKKVAIAEKLNLPNCYSDKMEYQRALARLSGDAGADATIITAATNSTDPVDDAVLNTRPGGKIVVSGVVKIEPDRNELWHKEIELVVSRAGGPGSLDELYENAGIDIPITEARWTQKRNLKEFFRLVTDGFIDPASLISERVPLKNVISTYEKIDKGEFSGIAPIVTYEGLNKNIPKNDSITISSDEVSSEKIDISNSSNVKSQTIDFIGAGQFAKASLLPILSKHKKTELGVLVTRTSKSSWATARKFKFKAVANNPGELYKQKERSKSLVIATRHADHSKLILSALNAGYQNIFVEKPISTTRTELEAVREAFSKKPFNIMVGYNRRFSPHAQKIKTFFDAEEVTNISYIVNAGYLSADHWVFKSEEGRSRIVGEMCHFFDFFQFITGSKIKEITAKSIDATMDGNIFRDNITVICKMDNGAVCNLSYYASGNRGMSRETVYIFGGKKSAHLDNFIKTKFFSSQKTSTFKTYGQKIGYKEEIEAFLDTNNSHGLTFDQIYNSTDACFTVEDIITGNAK